MTQRMFTLQVILSSYYQQILADITKDLCLFPFDSNKLLLIKKRPTKPMCFSNHTLPELPLLTCSRHCFLYGRRQITSKIWHTALELFLSFSVSPRLLLMVSKVCGLIESFIIFLFILTLTYMQEKVPS